MLTQKQVIIHFKTEVNQHWRQGRLVINGCPVIFVGWANGIIYHDSKISDAFVSLQSKVWLHYESNLDQNVATLHDAIGDLLAAVFRHDEDLTPSSSDEVCRYEL